MKRKKIIINGNVYKKVVFIQYNSEEQIKEIANILLMNFSHDNKIKKDSHITLNMDYLSGREVGFNIYVKDEIVERVLGVAYYGAWYPTADNVILQNSRAQEVFKEEGVYGVYGVSDQNLLENIVSSAPNSVYFGQDQYPTLIRKAVHYWWRFAKYQVFSNGNKRTGLLVFALFLSMNFMNMWDNEDALYRISMKIANDVMSEEDLYFYVIKRVGFKYKDAMDKYNSLEFSKIRKKVDKEDKLNL